MCAGAGARARAHVPLRVCVPASVSECVRGHVQRPSGSRGPALRQQHLLPPRPGSLPPLKHTHTHVALGRAPCSRWGARGRAPCASASQSATKTTPGRGGDACYAAETRFPDAQTPPKCSQFCGHWFPLRRLYGFGCICPRLPDGKPRTSPRPDHSMVHCLGTIARRQAAHESAPGPGDDIHRYGARSCGARR